MSYALTNLSKYNMVDLYSYTQVINYELSLAMRFLQIFREIL